MKKIILLSLMVLPLSACIFDSSSTPPSSTSTTYTTPASTTYTSNPNTGSSSYTSTPESKTTVTKTDYQ